MSILEETPVSLHEAAGLLPGTHGKPLNFSTVWRWILKGVLAADGERRVKLEAVRLGGRWVTSREALQRFSESLTERPAPTGDMRTPTERKRRTTAAKAKLKKMGI
jgi:Protein of unknown function (DUF1580)